jgi:aryl-alcohol dehydrogenase-like predicted oxidoreductase
MRTRTIGGVEVSAIGYGGVNLSLPDAVDERQAIRTIHAAIDAGITLLDTAHCSTTVDEPAHNERLVAQALASHPRGGDVLVATKGGHWRDSEHSFPVDGRRERIREHCETSLRVLGVDAIPLYQLHWPDPDTPVAESMGAIAELQREGKVRMAGVSNFSVAQIEEARGEVDVVSVQNRFSPAHADDRDVIEYCAREGIAYLSYTPLDGLGGAPSIGERLPAFARVAEERGVSPHRVVLAWHVAQAPVVIPIPGARRAETITDSAAAAELELTAEELALLDS